MLLDHSTEIDLQLAEDWKPSSTSQLLTKQNSSPGTSDKQTVKSLQHLPMPYI